VGGPDGHGAGAVLNFFFIFRFLDRKKMTFFCKFLSISLYVFFFLQLQLFDFFEFTGEGS